MSVEYLDDPPEGPGRWHGVLVHDENHVVGLEVLPHVVPFVALL